MNINIQSLLEMLAGDGMSDAEIGREIDAPQSIVTRLRNGIHKSTSYERGQKIAKLALERGLIAKDRSPGRRKTDLVSGRRKLTGASK